MADVALVSMTKVIPSIDMYIGCHGSHSAAAQRLVQLIPYQLGGIFYIEPRIVVDRMHDGFRTRSAFERGDGASPGE